MMEKQMAALSCVCADIFPELNEIRPGGEALNFALAASRDAGVRAHVLGAIGEDDCGMAIRARLRDSVVDDTHLHTRPGVTASHRIHLTADGDRYFKPNAWTNGVYIDYRPEGEDAALLRRMDAVHVTATCPVLQDVMRLRRESGFLLSVDFNDARYFNAWEKWLDDLDVFFISGEDAVLPRLAAWSERYDAVFVATLAARGSVAFHGGRRFDTQAVPVEKVVDTTGCGDSYQAGFMVRYVRDRNIQAAMENGSRFASETIGRLGGC